ncbi:MAG: UpxY family transcription antiterminator [Acidobacteria bacterium]|nr:UpxY family transcription antiterminator [Acidobacteriota bacterium]
MDEPERWYAVYTRSRHEKTVSEELQRRGIETFLPLREVLSQWKDRRQRIQVPLFRGYVFVRACMRRRRSDIMKVSGVVRIVGFDNKPAPIPDEEIEAVQIFLDTTIKYDPYPYLNVGRRVEIRRGALKGLQGILLKKKNKFKFVLSVHLIQQSVALEIDASEVEPIG